MTDLATLKVPPGPDADTVEAFASLTSSPNGQAKEAESRVGLVFQTAAEVAAEVDHAPPIGYLARGVWPADAYGIIAAEQKAGKTWAISDLIVAVAAGLAWMGIYQVERPGRVVVFLGEGGKRKMLRRLRAVSEFYSVTLEDLPIDLCFRAPHLGSDVHMGQLADKLDQRGDVVLVVVDPLYLAARGAKGASLYDMGEHLERAQLITQDAGAALAVVHHWNQTGKGKGAERMSGAGPAEWGRVLGSASVRSRHTDLASRATTVTLDWAFMGDEIADTALRVRRTVWADDPDNLASPMHYIVERLEVGPADIAPDLAAADLRPATKRVLAVLNGADDWLDVVAIGDRLANDETGLTALKRRTIQDACKTLVDAGFARFAALDGTNALKWRSDVRNTPEDEDENGF